MLQVCSPTDMIYWYIPINNFNNSVNNGNYNHKSEWHNIILCILLSNILVSIRHIQFNLFFLMYKITMFFFFFDSSVYCY